MFSDKFKAIRANVVASLTLKHVPNDLNEARFVSVMIHTFSHLNVQLNHLLDIIILRNVISLFNSLSKFILLYGLKKSKLKPL